MGGGYHSYFLDSGSEANEAGFKITRQYMKHECPGPGPEFFQGIRGACARFRY